MRPLPKLHKKSVFIKKIAATANKKFAFQQHLPMKEDSGE